MRFCEFQKKEVINVCDCTLSRERPEAPVLLGRSRNDGDYLRHGDAANRHGVSLAEIADALDDGREVRLGVGDRYGRAHVLSNR